MSKSSAAQDTGSGVEGTGGNNESPEGVAENAARELAMLPQSVQSAMLGRSQELLRRLQSERLNPSSWQPLESVKTFKDFAKYFDAEASRVTLRIADINGVRKGTNGVSTDGDTASFAMTYFPNLSAFLLILQRCHWC